MAKGVKLTGARNFIIAGKQNLVYVYPIVISSLNRVESLFTP